MRMSLFNWSDEGIELSSGVISDFKIDCDALTDADIECLANMIRARVGPFGEVEGVPTGGLRLAESLRRYSLDPELFDAPLLIVDDVVTTGASMERLRDGRIPALGAVIFARSVPPPWIMPLFRMP